MADAVKATQTSDAEARTHGELSKRVLSLADRLRRYPEEWQSRFLVWARGKMPEADAQKIVDGRLAEAQPVSLQIAAGFVQDLIDQQIFPTLQFSEGGTMSDNYSALLREKEQAERRLQELGTQIEAARAVSLAEKISKLPEFAKESFRDYAEAVKIPDADVAHILRGKVELCSSGRSVRVSADWLEAFSRHVDVDLL